MQISAVTWYILSYCGLLTAVALSSEREKLGEDVVEDFLRDEAARTLRLEYSVQPLHLSCAEPANIETTYYYLRHVMYVDGAVCYAVSVLGSGGY